MDGHQLGGLGALGLIHVGEQGGVIQVVAQGDLFPRLPGEVVDGLLQLRQVVQPLLLAAVSQGGLVAAVHQHAGEQLGQLHGIVNRPVLFHHADVVLGVAAAEEIRFQQGDQRLVQRTAVEGHMLLQRRDPGSAHAAPWLVDGAQEADVVLGIDHAKVT